MIWWQAGVVCTLGFLLFLCVVNAEMRARGQGQTWAGRQRPSEAHGQQVLVSQGATLGPDQTTRDQDLNLSRKGRGWAVTGQAKGFPPRPRAPEAPE